MDFSLRSLKQLKSFKCLQFSTLSLVKKLFSKQISVKFLKVLLLTKKIIWSSDNNNNIFFNKKNQTYSLTSIQACFDLSCTELQPEGKISLKCSLNSQALFATKHVERCYNSTIYLFISDARFFFLGEYKVQLCARCIQSIFFLEHRRPVQFTDFLSAVLLFCSSTKQTKTNSSRSFFQA